MGKRLIYVDGSVIFLGYFFFIINNYIDIFVIVYQFGGCRLGLVGEIYFYVYMVSNQILILEM